MSQSTQLFIDTLNLSLPPGFEGRSNAIARETVRQLSSLQASQTLQLSVLNIPKITLYGGEANGVIARRIAHAIHKQINTPVTLMSKRGHGHAD